MRLKDQQPFSCMKGDTPAQVAERIANSRSKLIAFFEYNEANEDSRGLLYVKFPGRYTYRDRDKCWHRWQRPQGLEMIGRLTYVPPISGEVYFMRLLLTCVRGPRS